MSLKYFECLDKKKLELANAIQSLVDRYSTFSKIRQFYLQLNPILRNITILQTLVYQCFTQCQEMSYLKNASFLKVK